MLTAKFDLLRALMMRSYRCPQRNQLSGSEQEVLTYMREGCSLWGAAMIAEVGLCEALAWLEHGEQYPRGPHSRFQREVRELERVNGNGRLRQGFDVGFSKLSRGYGQRAVNGNGHTNGNGSHEVLRIEDL